jgi:hypothetical protein
MRSISRVADVSINTVYKLLIDAGEACSAYQDQACRNLRCKRLQLDEALEFSLYETAQCHARQESPRERW